MIVNINGKQYETKDDEGVCVSLGIGESGLTYFGIDSVQFTTHIEQDKYKYDTITFCPHAHCTHTETINHIKPNTAYSRPSVPLFQLCIYGASSDDMDATAYIGDDPERDNTTQCSHWLTTKASVDAEQDGGRLTNHRRHFEAHPGGLITELVRVLPDHVQPGLYILMTAIMECPGSDSHPTHLRLFTII